MALTSNKHKQVNQEIPNQTQVASGQALPPALENGSALQALITPSPLSDTPLAETSYIFDVEAAMLPPIRKHNGHLNKHLLRPELSRKGTWGQQADVEDGLKNPTRFGKEFIQEKPWQRAAAELAAAGRTIKEIVEVTGRCRTAVQNAIAQPIAQERIVRTAKANAQDEVKQLLKEHGPAALKRVINISQTSDNAAVQLKANQDILDRFLGKAAQPFVEVVKEPSTMSDEELRERVESIVSESGGTN